MPFRIPTLDEARKKREGSAVIPNNFKSTDSKDDGNNYSGRVQVNNPYKRKHPSIDGHATAEKSTPSINGAAAFAAASSTSSRQPQHATKKIFNPYAKKSTTQIKAGGSSRGVGTSTVPFNPYLKKSSTEGGTVNNVGRSASDTNDEKKASPLHIRNYGPSATFSQAFESIEGTTHFERELDDVQKSGLLKSSDPSLNRDRMIQKQVDAADAEAAAVEVNEFTVSARENHAHLKPHILHVSQRQQGNPVLRHIRNVPMQVSKIVPDYIMGANRCALFLSLRYHSLHPDYIYRRIKELGKDFMLRVLLVRVDMDDSSEALLVLNKLAVMSDMTLLLSWSDEEAARYLETYKAYESKDASSIQKREKDTFADQAADVLSTIRSVNKTDVSQLLAQFSSIRGLMIANMDELSLVPGVGEKKVRRLHDTFHKPFSTAAARKRKEALEKARAESEEIASKDTASQKGQGNEKVGNQAVEESDV